MGSRLLLWAVIAVNFKPTKSTTYEGLRTGRRTGMPLVVLRSIEPSSRRRLAGKEQEEQEEVKKLETEGLSKASKHVKKKEKKRLHGEDDEELKAKKIHDELSSMELVVNKLEKKAEDEEKQAEAVADDQIRQTSRFGNLRYAQPSRSEPNHRLPLCRFRDCEMELIDPCPDKSFLLGVRECPAQMKSGANCVMDLMEARKSCSQSITAASFASADRRCLQEPSGLSFSGPIKQLLVYHVTSCGGHHNFQTHSIETSGSRGPGAALGAAVIMVGLVLSCLFLYCGGSKLVHEKAGRIETSNDGVSLLPSSDTDGEDVVAEKFDHDQCHRVCNKICFLVSFPFLFVFTPVYLYLVPCCYYTAYNTLGYLCCWCARCGNRKASRGKYRYQDNSFCGDQALGCEPEEAVEWKWAYEVCGSDEEDGHVGVESLFGAGIDSGDISQGQLGDCWLLSAIACLAEFPGAVQSVFVTRERSFRSKYVVRIWSNWANKWVYISVDDRIPCVQRGDKWKPLYCMIKQKSDKDDHHQYTIWSLVLEKAFAKYCGSYAKLEGGSVAWALQALTGNKVKSFDRENGRWVPCWIMPGTGSKENPRDVSLNTYGSLKQKAKFSFSDEQLFDQLLELDRKKAVMGAGSKSGVGKKDTKEDSSEGVVAGHAYTIKAVQKVSSGGEIFCLLQLRNPWGCFEWAGAWSDGSSMWQSHPTAKRQCNQVEADDGLFWMEMKDFVEHFSTVDVCYRTVSIADTHINLHEDKGMVLGTCFGCTEGMMNWYCCCGGVESLCFPVNYNEEITDEDKQEVHTGMCSGCARKKEICILFS